MTHIRRTGAVLWNCGRSLPQDHQKIKTGYFYVTDKQAITYQFKIQRFFDWSDNAELEKFMDKYISSDSEVSEADNFVPDFRQWDLIAIYDEFARSKRQNAIGILIKAIYPLKTPIDPRHLIKVSDGKPIKTLSSVRSHPIVSISSEIKPIRKEIGVKDLLHSHIRKIIDEGKFNEKDIEDMLEYILYDSNCELVKRQPSLKNGRIDIIYKKGQTYYVIEIKRRKADINAFYQIKKYIKDVKTRFKPKRIIGLIICETATKRLVETAKKPDNIFINEYKFSIDFRYNF